MTRRLLDQVARRLPAAVQHDTGWLTQLTEREREVLRLLAVGMSNAEIGGELVVSEPTVKTHVSRVLQKLGVRDRIQVVIYAYENGLLAPGVAVARSAKVGSCGGPVSPQGWRDTSSKRQIATSLVGR